MTTASPLYGSKVTMTRTAASLATSSTLIVGRESTAVDNKDVDDAFDALIGGLDVTGTSPTAAKQIDECLYGSYDDTNFSAGATGSDAGLTLTAETKTLLKLLTSIPTANTSDKVYPWGPFSAAQAFGGFLPVQWGSFVTHNTAVNLKSTGQEVEYFPVKVESA